MFEKIVSDLVSTGLTEKQIADLVGSSQSSINRLRHGKHTPQWPLGDSLVKLHHERCKQPAAA